MNISSDEAWLEKWRKGNRSLIHLNPYKDSEEKKQSHKWDLIRWRLREQFGDQVLNKVLLVPDSREDDE